MKKLPFSAFYEQKRDLDDSQFDLFPSGNYLAHFHRQLEIIFVDRGSLYVNINGTERLLVSGGIGISDSFDIHSYRTDDLEELVSYALIVSKDYLIDHSFLKKNIVLSEHFPDKKTSATVFKLFEILFSHYLTKNNPVFIKGITTAMVSELYSTLPLKVAPENDGHSIMRNTLNYLHRNFTEPITLEIIAKKLGYAPGYLSHIFNLYYNGGIKKYLNTLRIKNAIVLLNAGESSYAAAMKSGFGSPESFYRSFREICGTSPRKFLKSENTLSV